MRTFIDSSVIVNLLTESSGSILGFSKTVSQDLEQVYKTLQKTTDLATSTTNLLEILHMLNQKVQYNEIDEKTYQSIKEQLAYFCKDLEVIQINQAIFATSITIMERYIGKLNNTIFIACALEWKADYFLSLDKQQIAMAKKYEIKTL